LAAFIAGWIFFAISEDGQTRTSPFALTLAKIQSEGWLIVGRRGGSVDAERFHQDRIERRRFP